MYKSRRVLFSLFVNIPVTYVTTPRINFRISECHHRFSIDLIIIFSAKNGNSKKNTLGPYWSFKGGDPRQIFWSSRFEFWAPQVPLIVRETFGEILGPRRPTVSEPRPVCDRIGNSGRNRNRNRIAMIWPEPEPEPEPDCHPKKVAGFDRIGRI